MPRPTPTSRNTRPPPRCVSVAAHAIEAAVACAARKYDSVDLIVYRGDHGVQAGQQRRPPHENTFGARIVDQPGVLPSIARMSMVSAVGLSPRLGSAQRVTSRSSVVRVHRHVSATVCSIGRHRNRTAAARSVFVSAEAAMDDLPAPRWPVATTAAPQRREPPPAPTTVTGRLNLSLDGNPPARSPSWRAPAGSTH